MILTLWYRNAITEQFPVPDCCERNDYEEVCRTRGACAWTEVRDGDNDPPMLAESPDRGRPGCLVGWESAG